MSQFETQRRFSGIRRNTRGPAGDIGSPEGLRTPGLAAPSGPVVPVEAFQILQLVQGATGLVDAGLNTAANIKDRRDAKAQAAQDAEDRQVEGQASLDAATFSTKLAAQIAEGQYGIDTEADPEDVVQAAIDAHLGDAPDQVYRDQFTRAATLPTLRAVLGRQDDIRQQARGESAVAFGERARQATTADDLIATRTAAKDSLKLTDAEADQFVLQKLEHAVKVQDEDGFEMAAKVLGGGYASTIEKRRQDLESGMAIAEAREESQANKLASDTVSAILSSPEPNYESALKTVNELDLSDTQKAMLTDRIESDRTQRRRTEESAALDTYNQMQLDGKSPQELAAFAQTDRRLTAGRRLDLMQRIDSSVMADLRQEQDTTINVMQRDINLGRWLDDGSRQFTASTTMKEIVRRMDLPATSPLHVPAGQGINLLNVAKEAARREHSTNRISRVLDDMIAGNDVRTPAISGDDDFAILSKFERLGTIDVDRSGGDMRIRGITSPTRTAAYMQMLDHVPRDITQFIKAGLESDNPDKLQNATAMYVALAKLSPQKARAMDLGDGTAKLRARYLLQRADNTPNTAATSDVSAGNVATERMPELVALNAVASELKDQEVFGDIFYGDAGYDFGDAFAATVQHEGQELFSEALSDAVAQNKTFFGINVLGTTRSFTAPPDVVRTFNANIASEFRVQMALIGNRDDAIKVAKQLAVDQTMRQRPPILWNGRIYFQQHENAPHGDVQAQVRHELTVFHKDVPAPDKIGGIDAFIKYRQGLADYLEKRAVPVWNPGTRTYTFRSLEGNRELVTWLDNTTHPPKHRPIEVQIDTATPFDLVRQARETEQRFKERESHRGKDIPANFDPFTFLGPEEQRRHEADTARQGLRPAPFEESRLLNPEPKQ